MASKSGRFGITAALLLTAVCLVVSPVRAGNVRPLGLETIDGKPAARGAEFRRLIHLLALHEFGERYFSMGGSYSSPAKQLCTIALENLTESARQQVLSKKSGDPLCTLGDGRRRSYYGWRGSNKLDREDAQALFQKKYLPEIKKAAAKVASLESLKVFVFEGYAGVGEDDYSRKTQAFKITLAPWPKRFKDTLRFYNRSVGEWPVPESQARHLMNELFPGRTKYTQLRTLVTMRLGRAVPTRQNYEVEAYVTDIRLYHKNDQAFSKMLHHFGPDELLDRDAVARSKAPRLEFKGQYYLMAAYADLSGKGKSLVEELLDTRDWQGEPFRVKKLREEERKRLSEAFETHARKYSRGEAVWVQGMLSMDAYDMKGGFFPVREVKLNIRFPINSGRVNYISGELVADQVKRIPVPEDAAQRIANSYAYWYRALVRPVEVAAYRDDGSRSGKPSTRGHTVYLEILKMELVRNQEFVGIQYDGDVVWRYVPISYAELKKQKAQQAAKEKESLAKLRKQCEASGSSSCYQELCARIRASVTEDEYKACRKKLATVVAKEKRAQFNAAAGVAAGAALGAGQGGGAEPEKKVATNTRSDCGRKYGGYQAQPWIPISGTPEHKAAIEHCLKQPVREPYGRDILGLRLGMASNDANRLMQRQPYERNVLAEDSRPFEKGQLAISRDRNDGLAAFFLGNGNVDRVAAVSRRVYFKEGQMQAVKLQQRLRKKYGKESWSRGEAMMWLDPSTKTSPSNCSGLVSMLEERGGWRAGGWVLKGHSRANKGNASKAIGMQAGMRAGAIQQECMAKYGMPSGGADMQAQIQKLQRCMEEKMAAAGAAAGATADAVMADSEDQERRPYTVKMNAKPSQYAKYKACGPVVIALFNNGTDGSVKDLSLVLFDPEWVSRQPEFAFKQEGGAGLRF